MHVPVGLLHLRYPAIMLPPALCCAVLSIDSGGVIQEMCCDQLHGMIPLSLLAPVASCTCRGGCLRHESLTRGASCSMGRFET